MRLERVVYIDVLFGINFVGNYLLLWATDGILRLHTKGRWLMMGAAFGAIYASLIFFPRFSLAYSAAAKLVFSLALVALTYRIRGIGLYIKALLVFYAVSFVTGGALIAFFYVSGAGQRMGAVIRNGSLYFEVPWRMVIYSFAVMYPVVWLACRQLRKHKSGRLYPVHLGSGEKSVTLMGLLDTGNHLKEPFSGDAVLVAEYERVRDILPKEFCTCFERAASAGVGIETQWEELLSAAPELRLKWIPFRSVGKENGMLLGFRPERIFVEENEREVPLPKVVVGLYLGRLSESRRYGALLSPEMME